MAIWFFQGKEEFKIEKEVLKLKKELLDDAFQSMNYRVYYSPEYIDLLDILQSAPLMFGNTLSVIHCEQYFMRIKNKKTEFSDNQIETIEDALKNISEANNIVFICEVPRDEDKKPDSRTKLHKLFTKYSKFTEFNQYREFDKDFIPYVMTMVKDKELKASTKVIEYLTERLGVNLRLISTEIEKLATAIYPRQEISKKDVDDYCHLKDNIFELAELITSKNHNAIMEQLHSVLAKSHPLEICGLLQSNLRKLIYIKSNQKTMSAKMIADSLKMHEYPVKLIMGRIANISLEKLAKFKHNLTEAEYKIKTGQTINPEYTIENVLLGKDL